MSLDDEARPAARLTVLAGPSGAGRESVVELIRARSPSVWTPITVTTRPRRSSELDGVHRHFVTSEEFDRQLAEGELLEWSRLGGYRRGTEITPLRRRLAAGQPVLLALDLAGALLGGGRGRDSSCSIRPVGCRARPWWRPSTSACRTTASSGSWTNW